MKIKSSKNIKKNRREERLDAPFPTGLPPSSPEKLTVLGAQGGWAWSKHSLSWCRDPLWTSAGSFPLSPQPGSHPQGAPWCPYRCSAWLTSQSLLSLSVLWTPSAWSSSCWGRRPKVCPLGVRRASPAPCRVTLLPRNCGRVGLLTRALRSLRGITS